MNIDQLLNQVTDADVQVLHYPASWTQGRTAFGGLSCAIALKAMLLHCDAERTLRSFSAQFIGPIAPDEDFELTLVQLREGKSSCQYRATISQQGNACLEVQGLFARDRQSCVEVPLEKVTLKNSPNAQHCLPYTHGIMPAFFQHVDLNLHQGAMPYTGADSTSLQGWMRFKEQENKYDWAHVVALIDAWPPSQLQKFSAPAPASSMSWYIECFELPTLAQGQWLGLDITTTAAHNGYAYEDATLYTENGQVIARSKQTVALFA